MTFKQFIRLISVGLILVIVTSMIVLVLPENYITQSRNEVSLDKIDLKSFRLEFDSDNLLSGLLDSIKASTSNIVKPLDQKDTIQDLKLDLEEVDLGTYYKSAMGKTGEDLKDALNDIIDAHNELNYKEVWSALKEIDQDPTNSENVILIYTGKSISKDANGTGKDDWNREHVWAKSHGDFGTRMGAGTDLHHVRPADVTVNSSRNNKNFDNSENAHHEATLCKHDSDSFEPRDSVKGDVARMMFYMAVRYEGEHDEVDLELVEYMNESKSPHHGKLSTFIEWHENDPVSDFERRRNNLIYEKYQGNRNPFIDHPEWVEDIWDMAS